MSIQITSERMLEKISAKGKDVEIYKVLSGYLIKGNCEAIKEKLSVNDIVTYGGRVESGVEIIKIFTELKKLQETAKESNGKMSFENDVVTIIKVTKNASNKFDSAQIKMSTSSFMSMINSVMTMVNRNNLSTEEKMFEYLKTLDEESDEYKAMSSYLNIYSEHAYAFILHKYDIILENIKTANVRKWSIYDLDNDIDKRIDWELASEFHILA